MLLPPSLAAARAAGLLPGSRRPASGPRCLGRNVFPSDTEEGVSANPAGPSRLLWDQSPASWLGRGPRACPWPGPPTSSRPPASSSSSVVSVADDENTLFSPKKSNKNQPTPKKVNVVEKAACRGPLQVRDRGAALPGPPHVGLCGQRRVLVTRRAHTRASRQEACARPGRGAVGGVRGARTVCRLSVRRGDRAVVLGTESPAVQGKERARV